MCSSSGRNIQSYGSKIKSLKKLRKTLKKEHTFVGHGDCQIIPHLYEEFDISTIANSLSGKFGFTLYDVKKNKFYVVRDHIGIIPVYMGRGINGEFYVCSEMKGFHDYAKTIDILLPGSIYLI